MLVGGDEKPGGAGGGVVNRLADPRIDQRDDGADDVARRAELAEFAGLLDLAQTCSNRSPLVSGSACSRRNSLTRLTIWVSTIGSSIARRARAMKLMPYPSPSCRWFARLRDEGVWEALNRFPLITRLSCFPGRSVLSAWLNWSGRRDLNPRPQPWQPRLQAVTDRFYGCSGKPFGATWSRLEPEITALRASFGPAN